MGVGGRGEETGDAAVGSGGMTGQNGGNRGASGGKEEVFCGYAVVMSGGYGRIEQVSDPGILLAETVIEIVTLMVFLRWCSCHLDHPLCLGVPCTRYICKSLDSRAIATANARRHWHGSSSPFFLNASSAWRKILATMTLLDFVVHLLFSM